MAKKTNKLEYESWQNLESVIHYLEALEKGIENNNIVLSNGKEEIRLIPNQLIEFDIRAKSKSGRSKLTIELKWKKQ